MNIRSIILIFTLMFPATSAYGEQKQSFLEKVVEGVAEGMAREAGKRMMEVAIEYFQSPSSNKTNSPPVNNTTSKKTAPSWREDVPHPKYENVLSGPNRGEWAPKSGYVWSNSNDKNDWTVTPIRNLNRDTSYNKDLGQYQVVYKGRDGINVRSSPAGKNILATAFHQGMIPLQEVSSSYNQHSDWKKFKLRGWMVKKSYRTNKKYLSEVSNNITSVIWDGDRDPTDNFVNLRSTTNLKSTVVARIYTNTSVRVIGKQLLNNKEWVKVELIGWMRVKAKSGKKYISMLK